VIEFLAFFAIVWGISKMLDERAKEREIKAAGRRISRWVP